MKNKITWQKIVYLFVIGAMIGFCTETLWYYFRRHVWINKQGLLYGPIKPIYGLGVILFTLCLNKFREKNVFLIFGIATVVGTIFEYLCSLFQEVFLGTYTWTYAYFNYSFSSRIYLPYCVCWGIMGLVWIKLVFPFIEKWLDKIKPKISTVIAGIILILLLIDSFLTFTAISRMNERRRDIVASNKYEEWLDKTYPDDLMSKTFPKMRFFDK